MSKNRRIWGISIDLAIKSKFDKFCDDNFITKKAEVAEMLINKLLKDKDLQRRACHVGRGRRGRAIVKKLIKKYPQKISSMTTTEIVTEN